MTSKIVVNNIESDSGISSITFNSNITGKDSTQNISGINSVTATTYYGNGANLTGIDASSLKDGNNVKVQANSQGAVVTGTLSITDGTTAINKHSVGIGTTTTAGRDAGISTATGSVIFNSTISKIQVYDGSNWGTIDNSNNLNATGGTTSTVNGYKVHKFTSSGFFNVTTGAGEIEVLVVAGGGSEGGAGSGCHGGGGGGGGGVVRRKLKVVAGDRIYATIGAGGVWRNNGGDSSFGCEPGTTISGGSIFARGGGAGGPTLTGNGNAGGSGGGSSRATVTNQGGAGTQPKFGSGGMGNDGGGTGDSTYAGGGGGAMGPGQEGPSEGNGGGGPGYLASDFEPGLYVGAGGNGMSGGNPSGEGRTQNNNNGAANTGAGGGGSAGGGTRYSGGSGVIFVRYIQ